MTARRSVLVQLLALALAVAMSLATLPFLRGAVPTHWDLAGRPDAWGSPALALLLGPVLLLGLTGVSIALPSRARASTRDVLAGLATVAVFFLAEHGLTLGASALGFFPLRPLLALVFGLFAGLAPIVARVEQNPWFGVRTPWTLGSRRVWRETHRATGRLWFVGGLAGAALTMLWTPFPIVVAYLVLLVLAPIGISYAVWLRLGRG